jgi:hypothetical protein
MMSPSLVVFDQGQPSAPIPLPTRRPFDPFTSSTSARNQDNQVITLFSFLPTPCPFSKLAVSTPVHTLCSAYKSSIPPPRTTVLQTKQPTNVAPTKQRVKFRTPFLLQWLPPPCQISCFFSVGSFLVFPGSTSIVLPTPLLEKQSPYVYKCSCNINMLSSPISHSSITINPALPCQFNGAMFGKVFSSPIFSRPPAVHHLSATATILPTPEAVFQDSTETPSAIPQCSTIKMNALPHRYMGTMFGKHFFSAITITPTPEPDAPPPVAPPPVAVAVAIPTLQIDPIPPDAPLSVAASASAPSAPAPTSTFLQISSLTWPSSIPWLPILRPLYSKPVDLDQPPPKPLPIPTLHCIFTTFILIKPLAESISL